MSQMRKEQLKTAVIIVLGVLVFFGLIYIISENTGDRSNDKNDASTSVLEGNPLLTDGEVLNEDEQRDLVTISMQDLREILEDGEKRLVMLGTDTCYWCMQQKPIAQAISYQYDIEIDYLNVSLLTSDESAELAELHDSLASFGTPTFIVVEDGKVTTVSIGGRGTSGMTELLSQNGFID